MKKFLKHFRYGQKGFTLIELLVVIGILGAIAAVVVPNVGKFIGRGKTEAYATELHDIQTSVMAMLVDSKTSLLGGSTPVVLANATANMSLVVTTDTATTPTPLVLTAYLTGLGSDDPTTPAVETAIPPIYVKTGCTYWFDTKGTVYQVLPP
jgi:type IV pilus assembly protein PilA